MDAPALFLFQHGNQLHHAEDGDQQHQNHLMAFALPTERSGRQLK
jgi:hypothetical protein